MTPRPETLKWMRECAEIYEPYLNKNGIGLVPDAPKEAVEAFNKYYEWHVD